MLSVLQGWTAEGKTAGIVLQCMLSQVICDSVSKTLFWLKG